MSEHQNLIIQFMDVTSCSEDRARFYLESSNWTLQLAISSFYEHNVEEEEIVDLSGRDISPSLEMSQSELEPSSPKPQQSTESQLNAEEKWGNKSSKPKVATLFNRSPSKSSDDEDEGQQVFYAGGSERSGQQVLGPAKHKNFGEKLTEMFRNAQEDPLVREPEPSSSRAPQWGRGLRLGQTESDHEVVSSANAASNRQAPEPIMLRLYRQGFLINDGELRSYDDTENREFLETVMRGQIPNELRRLGNMVSVDVEDHRLEEYKQPKKTVKKDFKGSGHTLGNPVPNTEVMNLSTNNAAVNVEAAVTNSSFEFNSNEPSTNLQIRLADGTRLTGQFNLSHTVEDIRQYIISSRPEYATRSFVLVTSFPTKELNESSETIDKAGLKNASLMQRLK